MTSGTVWAGKVISREGRTVTLGAAYPFNVGVPGMGDLLGGSPLKITQEMVGKTVMVLTSVEVKSKNDKPRKGQKEFLTALRSMGARAGIARSADEALDICSTDPVCDKDNERL